MSDAEKLRSKIKALEKENQELKQLHSETEKLSLIGSYKINLDTGEVEWTNGLREIFGLSMNDEVPTPDTYYHYVHPEDRDQVRQMYTDSAVKGSPFDLKYRIVLNNNTLKHVHSKSEVITNKEGNRVLFGFFRDISRETLLLEKVQNSNEKFQLLLNSLQEGVSLNKAIYDDKGNIIDHEVILVNEAFNRHSYLNAKDTIGKKASEVYEMPQGYIKTWWLENRDKTFPVYTEMKRPGDRWVYLSTSEVKDSYFVTAFLDITEKKKQDLFLEESEQKYKSLVEDSPSGVVILKNEQIEIYNKAGGKLCDISKTKRSFLQHIHNEDKPIFESYLNYVKKNKKNYPTTLSLRLINKNQLKHTEVTCTQLKNHNNEQIIQLIINDVSETVKLKNKSKHLLTDALYLSRKLQRFSDIKEQLIQVIDTNNLEEDMFCSLIKVLNEERNMEQIWSIFKQNFEVIYDDFFKKLLKTAPNLSQQELKHCAFIRMNFETKEIAGMFNIKPTTVQISRVRIKKKLKLDSEQELAHFILTL